MEVSRYIRAMYIRASGGGLRDNSFPSIRAHTCKIFSTWEPDTVITG